jgi:hypothetical protein
VVVVVKNREVYFMLYRNKLVCLIFVNSSP